MLFKITLIIAYTTLTTSTLTKCKTIRDNEITKQNNIKTIGTLQYCKPGFEFSISNSLKTKTPECMPCEANSYRGKTDKECVKCPPGYSSNIGSTECNILCTLDMFNKKECNVLSDSYCPINHYIKNKTCVQCDYNQREYIKKKNQKFKCDKCPEGHILHNGNCYTCHPGTYQKDNHCQMCPIGYYSSKSSTNTCMRCENNEAYAYYFKGGTTCESIIDTKFFMNLYYYS